MSILMSYILLSNIMVDVNSLVNDILDNTSSVVDKVLSSQHNSNKIEAIVALVDFSFDMEKTLTQDYAGYKVYSGHIVVDHENLTEIPTERYKDLRDAYVPSMPRNEWKKTLICLDDFINSIHEQDKGFGTNLIVNANRHKDLLMITGDYTVYSVYFVKNTGDYDRVIRYLRNHGYTIRTLIIEDEVSVVVYIDGGYYWFSHEAGTTC